MHRTLRLELVAIVSLIIMPASVYAQASITGVVRDTSGAVLPGVTVEASSPALLEKVRAVVTDGTGQYRIESLRPGVYSVTFTLPGFSLVRREGLELTGTFTATVNAELRVGTLEETITVAGETPLVDVQNTRRQRVLDTEDIDALPSGRHPVYLAALIPSVSTGSQDVGGVLGAGRQNGAVTVHGNSDVRTQVNGVSMHTAPGNGNTGVFNLAAFEEMAVDTGGISAEQKEGGVRINMVPRDGGNTLRGYFYGAFAGSGMQGDNFSQELKDRGLGTPDSLKRFWDLNPAFGGPIKRDKVWFHTTVRHTGAWNYVAMFFNRNAGNPNAWTYEPDTSRAAAATESTLGDAEARVAWQVSPRNKVGVSFVVVHECACPRSMTAQTAPETRVSDHARLDPQRHISADWTAPWTNRLLLEAAALKTDVYATRPTTNQFIPSGLKLNGVTEQSNNLAYRATSGFALVSAKNPVLQYRLTMSYVTGAHAAKVGVNYGSGGTKQLEDDIDSPMSFRFNNGIPNRLTLRASPIWTYADIDADHGFFVQDRWTVNRLTLTAGLRYDYFHNSFPETTIGPGPLAPNRNIVLPAADGVTWHDIEPRVGVAYDLLGNGKTALKVSLNKYLPHQGTAGTFGINMAPVSSLVRTTDRSWNDGTFAVGDPRRGNFVPDCDLLDPLANGECGAMANRNFGTVVPGVTYDRETLDGWGKRAYSWEFSAGIQHELLPRVSMDVTYFRSWFGNFVLTDDRAVGPSDYDAFSITAPLDSRLPGSGGYVISGLYDLKPAAFGKPAQSVITLADLYGKQIRHWNGVDLTLNARLRPGLSMQGGISTGRTSTDNCEVVAKVADPPSQLYCHVDTAFLPQIKFVGTYTVPRLDLRVTGTLQNLPGQEILANYNAPNAAVVPSLGRNLAGGASNVTVNLVKPGTMYGERTNQLDLRFSRVLRFGRTRLTPGLDVYNVLNANSVLRQSNAFATWLRPEGILNARFAKVIVQVDF